MAYVSSGMPNISFSGSTLNWNGKKIPFEITEVSVDHNPIWGVYSDERTYTITGRSISSGATANTSNWTYYDNYDDSDDEDDEDYFDDESEDEMTRGLFVAYIVDPETDTLAYVSQPAFVATNEANAKIKAVQRATQESKLEKDVDDYDIILLRLGDVRAKREVQEVKVINNTINKGG